MKFNLRRVLESKRAKRRDLAALPVGKKLVMLDALRDRARVIRDAAAHRQATILKDSSPEYRADSEND